MINTLTHIIEPYCTDTGTLAVEDCFLFLGWTTRLSWSALKGQYIYEVLHIVWHDRLPQISLEIYRFYVIFMKFLILGGKFGTQLDFPAKPDIQNINE